MKISWRVPPAEAELDQTGSPDRVKVVAETGRREFLASAQHFR